MNKDELALWFAFFSAAAIVSIAAYCWINYFIGGGG